MLVVDASVALRACGRDDGFRELRETHLIAPPLMWSEARSALHEATSRGELASADAEDALNRLEHCPVQVDSPPELGPHAWALADKLGWAKTYDAEYIALAALRTCRVVTLDGRLLRGAARLGLTVAPGELR